MLNYEIKARYTNYINELIDKFGFGSVLNNPDSNAYRWDADYDNDLRDAGYTVCSGYCRMVIFHEEWDYVIKFTYNEDAKMAYCANEEFLYGKAAEWGISECFAGVYFLGEFDNTNIYLVERCDCDEDKMYNDSYDNQFRNFCRDRGYSAENANDDIYEEFQDSCDYECSGQEGMLELAASRWGRELADKVFKFLNYFGVNDCHSANWGYLGTQLVIIDYAGYGEGAESIANARAEEDR